MLTQNGMIRLTDEEMKEFSSYLKANYGIDLTKKKQLIEARMHQILAQKKVNSFTDYFKLLKQERPEEIDAMLNRLTTNHTYFMREPKHFDFLRDVILPMQEKVNAGKEFSVWSAGCSTGEEAYTAAMVIRDFFAFRKWDFKILATDISTQAMEGAKAAIYHKDALSNLPPVWLKKYFVKKADPYYALSEDVKKDVIFRKFNLMDPFCFTKPFDLIFCRNVMIYFDQPTKDKLIEKFYHALKKGGYLFIGHSETVQRGITAFTYIKPSVYRKG